MPVSLQSRLPALLPATLAVLGPLVVLGLFLAVLLGYADEAERQALENAGRVLNARVAEQGDAVTVMERMLRQSRPRVLILGPSYANTDVDPRLLAQRLRLPRDEVLLLSVPNSTGAHWYAMLKNRVYANGHRPELVVVVSGLQSMLLTTPLTEASYVNLAVHLDGPDPVLQDKVRTSTRLVMARLREKRGMLREGAFGILRDVPAGWLLRSPSDPLMPIDPEEIRGALDAVFADENVDMSLHTRGVLMAEVERPYDASMLPSPERSLIPDITELVREHGGAILWVRPPMSPDIPAELDDVVLPGVQEDVVALVHERGGAFIDMRGLPMTSDMFKNADHMNLEGSRRFTEALARVLRERDVLDLQAPRARRRDGGTPPRQAVDGVRADLFGVFRSERGVLIDETIYPTYPDPPGPVPQADRPVQEAPGRIGMYDVSSWEFLSDERLMGESNFGSRCSPLRVTEDGVELPRSNVPCVDVKRHGGGRSCHTPDALYFTTTDGTDPRTNGRTYRLTLDAGRRCDGAAWLYPKDRFEVAWPETRLGLLEDGADTLTFGARYLQRRRAIVEVVLRVDGEERVRADLNGLDLKGGPAILPIEPPIAPGATDVRLEVQNLDHTFYLVTDAALSRGPVGRTGPGRASALSTGPARR